MKQQFVRLLREVLRNSGMTRGELIGHLRISASGMSQMLNGDLLPTIRRLDQIIELLHPSAEDAEKLQTMVLWLRSGSSRCPSEFNRRLFMARCQSSLSIEQLAMAAAIPVSRLRRLERTSYAEPTSEEISTLSGILGQPLKDGYFVTTDDMVQRAPLEVADSAISVLPLISVESLGSYSARMDLIRFSEKNRIGYWSFYLLPAEAVTVVRASSSQFGIDLPGQIELVLGNRRPGRFFRLDLCRDARGGGLFLDGDVKQYGDGVLAAHSGARPVWRLPVLRMSHIPDGGFL